MIVEALKKQLKKCQQDSDDLRANLKNKDLTNTQRRSLAARILGVHRRYKQALLVEVTAWALETDNSPASKHKVEKWQETHFGHSISNNKLTAWTDKSRGCGDRAQLEISDETTGKAQELYRLFEAALKGDLDESRLLQLTAELFSSDLGV